MKPRRFRFWVWWNDGPIKLTVTAKNDEKNAIVFSRYNKTEEGWNLEVHFYWLELEVNDRGESTPYVYSAIYTDGKDCDGRLSTTGTWTCPTHRLNFFTREETGSVLWPEWKEQAYKQRDYNAEKANY